MAIGITEPDFSSDYILPYDKAAGPHLVAERCTNGWTLNGIKHFISNGSAAALYVVFARTSKDSFKGANTILLLKAARYLGH